MVVADPVSAVRFALDAHLRAIHVREGQGAGRAQLQKYLRLQDSAFSDKRNSGRGLAQIAVAAEELGIARPGSLTSLVERVELVPQPGSTIGASWWPTFADMFRIKEDAPEFRNKYDVLLAGEAFAAFHKIALENPANYTFVTSYPSGTLDSCVKLLERLCFLASGPFGVAQQANRLIAQLAPLSPGTVTSFIKSGVVTTQVIHALDRSLRRAAWNAEMRAVYEDLLADPPDKIYRRTYWIRALRRLKLTYGRDEKSRGWIIEQLSFALHGQRSYSGARPTDRRYALWCLAELAPDGNVYWDMAVDYALSDPDLEMLVEPAKEMRRRKRTEGPRFDAFRFEPSMGWVTENENKLISGILGRPVREHWGWATDGLRGTALDLLTDALLNPDVIRQRAVLDAIRVGPDQLLESVSQTLVAVLEGVQQAGGARFIVERCLAYLGMLGRQSAIPAVDAVLQSSESPVLVQAVATAGDLAYRHRKRSPGIMGWVVDRVNGDPRNEDLMIAGVHALAAYKPEKSLPWEQLDIPEPTTWAVQTTVNWSKQAFADPWFRS